jgi:5-methylcytosine-specific restriction endonuclease McrA
MITEAVVLLNADYQPLNVISFQRALKLLYKKRIEVVAYSQRFFYSAEGKTKIYVPKLVRLLKFIVTIYRTKVPYSKRNVFLRDNYECAYCGKKVEKPTIDHVVPKAMGGKSDFANTVTSCFQCNARKDNRTPETAGMTLKKRPHAPSVVGFIFQQIKHLGLDKVVEEYVNVKV